MKYEIGINSNCGCGDTFEESLRNIKAAGFENVMLSGKSGDLEKSIQFARKIGLKIPCAHIFTKGSEILNSLWATGEENKWAIEAAVNEINICGKYEVPMAVMHVTDGSSVARALGPNMQGVASFQKILDATKAGNVRLAIENTDSLNEKHVGYLLDNIKSDWLGLCYDCGHNELYNEKTDYLKKYADKCISVHLHDNLKDWKLGHDWTRDLHLLPFDGKIDFEKVMQNIAASGYKDILILELHKDTVGEFTPYKDMTAEEYLKQAKTRGEKLAKMS